MSNKHFAPVQPVVSRRQLLGGMIATATAMPLISKSMKTALAENAAGVVDGVYTSSMPAMNDVVNVTVTIADGKIANVEVAENSETPGIGGRLLNKAGEVKLSLGKSPVDLIPEMVVAHNSLAVDLVSGATISSFAVLNAIVDCVEQAGGKEEDFLTPVPYEMRSDFDADVVVLGGGGAGLAAAIVAAQQGKKVAIVEKNGECGGDTLVCGAIYNCPDPELQAVVEMSASVKNTVENALTLTNDDPVKQAALLELQQIVGEQWEEYKASGRTDLFDTKEWFALQTWINGDMVANPELVKVLAYNAYDGLDWLKSINMEFSPVITQGAGSLWQRTHTSTMNMGTGFMSTYATLVEQYADLITVFTESTGVELVTDGDRVTGVVAVDNHNGVTFTVNATDGVILCTGGYSANAEMVQSCNTTGKWPDLSETLTTNRFSCSQGQGITMAQEVGASTTDMDQIQLLYLGNIFNGQITKYTPRAANGTDQVIFVNKYGERFVQEDGRRDQICLGVLDQPDQMFYLIESGDGAGYVDIHDPAWRGADGFTFDYMVANGYVVWDETLEGLAVKLDMDPATLQATVDAFNACVEAGEDEVFGRTLFTTKLEHGPWVATPRLACIHHTMGGLTIDTSAHVLDLDGAPIAGLYAAGETVGGIHGGNRLGGNAVVDTVVFGKLAADTLVADN